MKGIVKVKEREGGRVVGSREMMLGKEKKREGEREVTGRRASGDLRREEERGVRTSGGRESAGPSLTRQTDVCDQQLGWLGEGRELWGPPACQPQEDD